ncbi:MAG: hypothetical protein HRT44_08375 [Bdellovibrionales bacterium]|nr:protein-glutamine glutaminase family protein [Bdellovibrionales bacterium]NQZ19255.1 hypothetical protein [Bdellovibrionales bacterium]
MLKLFIAITFFSLGAQANISAKRLKGQDFKEIISLNLQQADSTSALNSADLYENLNHAGVVEWPSMELIQRRFEQIRDDRFLTRNEGDEFMRRISWLYPDDGCFARAAKFIERADEENYLKPERIFIFGNLNASRC